MKRKISTILAVSSAFLFLNPARAFAKSPSPLADRVEAVIIKGKDLPASMLGGAINNYRVFSEFGEGPAAIPMQIEERDEKGIILVTEGPSPDPVDGKFDAGDELSFMAQDAGLPDRGDAPAGCSKTAGITMMDKKTGVSGQVVLALCENPPPLSSRDYARYDPKTRTVITDRYRLGRKVGEVYAYDYISVNNGPDLLDRLKVRVSIGKWGVFYTFNEDHFHHRLLGWNDGPVRVTWKSYDYWSLGPLGKIAVPQYFFYYQDYAVFQDAMDARMNPALLGLDLSLFISHDLALERREKYVLCVNVLSECEPLGQKLSVEKVKALTELPMEWGGVNGPEGALITRLVVAPDLTARVKGIFALDPEYANPPEYFRGALPELGFNIVEWKNVKPAIYDLIFYHYFLNNFPGRNSPGLTGW